MSGASFSGQEEEAGLEQVRRHCGEQQQSEQRQQAAGQRVDDMPGVGDEELRIGREPGLAAKLLGSVAHECCDDRHAQPEQRRQAEQQQEGGGQVLALGHLPFLAGLLPAVRRGVLCLFAVGFGHGKVLSA